MAVKGLMSRGYGLLATEERGSGTRGMLVPSTPTLLSRFGLAVSRRTSVRIRFGSPFSSKVVVCGLCPSRFVVAVVVVKLVLRRVVSEEVVAGTEIPGGGGKMETMHKATLSPLK